MAPEEFFYKLNRLHRILILAGIGVVLLVGFYFLIISDILDNIGRLEKRREGLRVDIAKQESRLQQGPKLEKQIEALKRQLETVVASLPEKQDIEALLKKITDLLSETALVAKRFVPGQEQINRELYYARIPIELSVRGNYSKQGTFLSSLNNLPRIVNVPTIKLSASGGLSGREQDLQKKLDVLSLDADISAVTFRRLSKEEIDAIAKQRAPRPRGKH
jgi:type IV pilus assembly protein PilO